MTSPFSYHSIKRFFDIVFSCLSLVLLSPILLLVSLCIYFERSGPIFFVQLRLGRHGSPFRFFKFRTLPLSAPLVSSDKLSDLRLSPFSRFLRRTSIDELPQLINILLGDMSFVGPRPSMLSQTALNEERIKLHILDLRPGLTGLAQVRSYDAMPMHVKLDFDLQYCKQLSPFLDLKILFMTLKYLCSPPPKY